jgi:serine/threonine protein kinase
LSRERYLHEIQSVACLSEHPNVVKYYRGWQQEGHFFIQMELCEGGNLKDWTDRQTAPPGEDRIWDWVRQVGALVFSCTTVTRRFAVRGL